MRRVRGRTLRRAEAIPLALFETWRTSSCRRIISEVSSELSCCDVHKDNKRRTIVSDTEGASIPKALSPCNLAVIELAFKDRIER